jgi:diaminohydroxyphosphoribosylaminopyrimidine deaminase / 5-amino-6-(5-phosphoribosylamino)uracil reductase
VSAGDDLRRMRSALRLAERSLGNVAPNPAVGCVIVSPDGRVVARGRTKEGGRPHAETVALEAAGAAAQGATVYVTLEPCSHHGETPPCAAALVASGVARVVVAIGDPDARVDGRGIARLREAGIRVDVGVLEHEAAELNRGFFLRTSSERPLVTLKIAQSLDGRAATASGESKWITSEAARAYGHLLRARHDAILIGIETALADDPELTCRIPGLERRSPVRVVLDSRLRLSEWSKLAQTACDVPTLVFTSKTTGGPLEASGVEIVQVERDVRGRPDVGLVLKALAARGVTRLLVEGGASVQASFLDRGLADRLEVFGAPMVLGGGGRPSIDAVAALSLDEAPRFRRTGLKVLGTDVLESFVATA